MKRILIVLAIALFVLVGCGDNSAEYKKDLEALINNMDKDVKDATEIIDLYSYIWDYTIKSRGSMEIEEVSVITGLDAEQVKEHFPINTAGYITDDFSNVINAMKSYYDVNGEFGVLRESSENVKTKLSEMNEPPKGYEDVYNEVLDFYNLTDEYIRMALDPDGSLQSFNEKKQTLSSEIKNKKTRIEVIMPSSK